MDLKELKCKIYDDLGHQMVNREQELGISLNEYRDRLYDIEPGIDYTSVKYLIDSENCELLLTDMVKMAEALECILKIELVPKSDDYEYYADIKKLMSMNEESNNERNT